MENTSYFSISYPCNYKIKFIDTGGFYLLNDENTKNKIYISSSLYDIEHDIDNIKKMYPISNVSRLNDKLNAIYPYKISLVNIPSDAGQSCNGECTMYPGYAYYLIKLKINDNLYYGFQASYEIGKNNISQIVESFKYNKVASN